MILLCAIYYFERQNKKFMFGLIFTGFQYDEGEMEERRGLE